MAKDIKVPEVQMPDTSTLTKDVKMPEMKMPDVKPQGSATSSSGAKPAGTHLWVTAAARHKLNQSADPPARSPQILLPA